jgi:catechol 2,3-dioxygenase-like lactoylglutathione lyase family enzyme
MSRLSADADRMVLRGVNHLALVCRDLDRTVAFYRDVLGLAVTKTIELPDGLGTHVFFDLGNGDSLAFFWFPHGPAAQPGVAAPAALPGLGDMRSAVGSMNHVAFDVAPEQLDGYAQRLRRAGVEVLGPVNHDDSPQGWSLELHDGVFMRSVYFFDPDGICLELAAWLRRPAAVSQPGSPTGVAAAPAAP